MTIGLIDFYIQLLSSYSNAFDCRMSVAILSMPNGVDFSEFYPQYKGSLSKSQSMKSFGRSTDDLTLSIKPMKLMHIDSNLNLEGLGSSNSNSITIPQPGMPVDLSNAF